MLLDKHIQSLRQRKVSPDITREALQHDKTPLASRAHGHACMGAYIVLHATFRQFVVPL